MNYSLASQGDAALCSLRVLLGLTNKASTPKSPISVPVFLLRRYFSFAYPATLPGVAVFVVLSSFGKFSFYPWRGYVPK